MLRPRRDVPRGVYPNPVVSPRRFFFKIDLKGCRHFRSLEYLSTGTRFACAGLGQACPSGITDATLSNGQFYATPPVIGANSILPHTFFFGGNSILPHVPCAKPTMHHFFGTNSTLLHMSLARDLKTSAGSEAAPGQSATRGARPGPAKKTGNRWPPGSAATAPGVGSDGPRGRQRRPQGSAATAPGVGSDGPRGRQRRPPGSAATAPGVGSDGPRRRRFKCTRAAVRPPTPAAGCSQSKEWPSYFARIVPASTCPTYSQPQGSLGHARATPAPPKPKKCLQPAPRPRQCPVTPGCQPRAAHQVPGVVRAVKAAPPAAGEPPRTVRVPPAPLRCQTAGAKTRALLLALLLGLEHFTDCESSGRGRGGNRGALTDHRLFRPRVRFHCKPLGERGFLADYHFWDVHLRIVVGVAEAPMALVRRRGRPLRDAERVPEAEGAHGRARRLRRPAARRRPLPAGRSRCAWRGCRTFASSAASCRRAGSTTWRSAPGCAPPAQRGCA
eukprot:gene8857-biopygen13706